MSEQSTNPEFKISPVLPEVVTLTVEAVERAVNEIKWLPADDPITEAASKCRQILNQDPDYDIKELHSQATGLLVAIWRQIVKFDRSFPERGPVPDAALDLRDTLNPNWPGDSDWLPDELLTEAEDWY